MEIHLTKKTYNQIDELVQERRNFSANALELRLSCTNPSKLNIANAHNSLSLLTES